MKESNLQLRGEVEESRNRQKELDDLERLNNLLRLKVDESAKWEASNEELMQKVEYLEEGLNKRGEENKALRIEMETMTLEKKSMLSQLTDYKLKVQNILGEVERLQQILENIKEENRQLKQDNYELKQSKVHQ